jgi:hypothetical protein
MEYTIFNQQNYIIMRKSTYFYSLLLTALFLLPWSGMKAETLTVADGTTLRQRLPMYGYYGDEAQHNQFIFLSSELSDMSGATITGFTFYMDKNYTWKNNNAPTATFRFAEVTATLVSPMITVDETFKQVFSGTIVFANNEWNITLDQAYTYNGGNLVIDVQTTAAQYINNNSNKGSYFYSANVAYGRGNYNSSSAQEYIPKTTFTYELVGCTTPKSLSATAASSTSANVTWIAGTNETAWQLRYREKTEPESSWSDLVDVTTASKTLSELATDKTYQVQVRSNCGEGDENKSDWTASAEFSLVSCATVTGVSLDGKVYNGVTVNWTTSAPGNCDVQYKEAGDADWTSAGTNLEGSSKTITGLVVGKTYSFQVKPNCSTDGWVAAGETYAPAFPTPDPSVSAKTDATATITWDAVTDATGYKCLYVLKDAAAPNAAAWVAAETLTGLSASLTSLAGGTDYDVYVLAVFATGESDPVMVDLQTTTIAPTALVQEGDATTSSIAFSWSYAGAATQFQWKSSKEGSVWSDPISVLTATETGLSAGTSYTFYVRAYYSETVQSAELSGSLKTECGTETLPKTFSSWTAIPNCWYALRTSDAAYNLPTVYSGELKFYGNNSSSKKTRKAVLVLPKFEKDIKKLQVEVEYQNGGTNSTTNPQFIVGYVTDPEDVETFHTIAELERYYSYSDYKTSDAIDLSSATADSYIAIAYGNPNSTASSPTDRSAYIKSITVSEIPECPAVTEVTLDNKSYNSATVNWTISPATNCDVRYSTDGGTNWTSAATNVSATSQAVTVAVGNTYTFAVKPHCNDAEEAWVTCAETYTPAYGVPGVPVISDITINSASATWTAATGGATGYEYVIMDGDAAVDWTSPTQATSPAELTGLTEGTNYTLYVRAQYGAGRGEASSKNFTTATVAPAFTSADPATTATTATIALEDYTGAATQFQYVVMPGTTAANWTGATLIAPTTSIALSGLTASTSYTLYVRAYYSENIQSAAVSKPFQTECETKTIGWTENFDGGTLPACWDNSHYTYWGGSYIWQVSTAEAKSGSYSMMINSNKYNTSYTADLETPEITISEKANLTYYWRSESGVPVTVYAKEGSTETELASLSGAKTSWGTTPTIVAIPDNYVGKKISIIFRATGAGTSSSKKLYLDDVQVVARPCPQLQNLAAVPTPDGAVISWEQGEDENRYQYCVVDEGADADGWVLLDEDVFSVTIEGKTFGNNYDCYVRSYCSATKQSEPLMVQFTPACVAPSALEVSAITGSSATISWTSKAGKLQYKAEGDANWTSETLTAATSFNLIGLQGSTNYSVKVQAACAENDEDYWSAELAFTTKCALKAVAELPYNEDFAAGIKPDCFEFITTSEYPQISNNKIWFQGEAEQMVVFPGFDINLNELAVSFDYTASSASIELGYIPAAGGAFQSLGAYTSGALLDLTAAPANTKGYLAVRYYDATASWSTGSVDNVHVTRHITLADGTDNTSTMNEWKNKTIDVTIGRTFVRAGYYNTICLPFSLSAEELAASPIATNDLWAFKYMKVEGDELLIRIIEASSINAGEPYLIAWPAGDNIVSPLFKNVTITASVGQAMGDDNNVQFRGILAPETFTAGDNKKLFVAENNMLYWWDGTADSQLNSFRAYFYVNTGTGSGLIHGMPARFVKIDDTITGVENVQGDVQSLKVLENNQVVIIRNGVKYTIQGQVISK